MAMTHPITMVEKLDGRTSNDKPRVIAQQKLGDTGASVNVMLLAALLVMSLGSALLLLRWAHRR